jgi:hypothetical protein
VDTGSREENALKQKPSASPKRQSERGRKVMLKWVNSLVKRTSTIAELKKRISVITAVLGAMEPMDIRITTQHPTAHFFMFAVSHLKCNTH